jgi:hypothetical protein
LFHCYFEFRIELLQHSTGIKHPLAAEPSIVVSCEYFEAILEVHVSMAMEVFGENLVLTLEVEDGAEGCSTRLYTFNWKTGDAKCVSNATTFWQSWHYLGESRPSLCQILASLFSTKTFF